jgi:hypothetical protein
MQLTLELEIPRLPNPIDYHSNILLIGSCFSENMSEKLVQSKFSTCNNPHGILFNPLSVAYSLDSYINEKKYSHEELFYLNELWNSWDHHTKFSHTHADEALKGINESQQKASAFLKSASHIIITLGSAFQYYLKESGKPVANNHRAPAQGFEKRLLSVDVISRTLGSTIEQIKTVNPGVQLIFTVSPVRHIRDGVIDNNRSKARLLEAVHLLCAKFERTYYFPSYEIMIDILRDYRFYDIDFVHPNYLATSYIWEQFIKSCMDSNTLDLMKQVQDIMTARKHRARFPKTQAHVKFRESYIEKIKTVISAHPHLNFAAELQYFSEL